MTTHLPASEPWPPPWARTVAFFFGLGLMTAEFALDHSNTFFVYGIGLILTGLPIARGMDALIGVFTKGK